MAKLKFLLLALICSWLTAGQVLAAAPDPQEIARQLQKTYEQTNSFQADFHQHTTVQLSHREREGQGSLIILKPGLMRWDYTQPDRQVFICNGEPMSMYFAKSAQEIVMSAKDYLQSDVTYSFFIGTGDILRDFEPRLPGADYCCGEKPDLLLYPRGEHGQVEHLEVWLNDRHLVRRLKIFDHFGSVTVLDFSNIRINQNISPQLFKFTPPPGTEIVQQ